MLCVATVSRGGIDYYLRTVPSGPVPSRGLVEADGLWTGRLAATLGLSGDRVERGAVEALWSGVHPRTGETLDPRHARVGVLAFDCTFSAPKSVSVVHAVARDPEVVSEIAGAHEASVAAALSYVEDEAGRVRRRSGGEDRVVRSGLVAASFVHRVSRAEDPHLHSHVVVANLGKDEDGRWSALDGRALFLHAGTAGVLYRAQLRAELVSRLGVAWRWREDGFADLAGLRTEVVREFSRRSAEIAASLASEGRSGARASRVAASRTRAAKDLSVRYEELVARWTDRAASVGVTERVIEAVVPRRGQVALVDLSRDGRVRRGAPNVLDAPFTQQDLVVARAQSLEDGAPAAAIVERVASDLRDAVARGSGVEVRGRRAPTASLRTRTGSTFPSGVVERVLVTSRHLERERTLAAQVGAAHDLVGGPLPPGLWRPPSRARSPFEVGSEVARAIGVAARSGRPVIVLAPGGLEAAHAEAVLGFPAVAPTDTPRLARDGLVVAFAVDAWPVATLDRLVACAAASRSSLVLVSSGAPGGAVASPRGRGRAAGGVGRPPAKATDAPAFAAWETSRPPRGPGGGPVDVVLVEDARHLPRAASELCDRYRAET
ncbi:MAG: relaxase domain-containing protein, partial [Actinomycetota bacterium]|nr:relaxase domain-containing protein [Actinomycetota bacterium]